MRTKKPHIEPLIGSKIGKLTVIGYCAFDNKKGVICKCDCGNEVETLYYSVKYQLKTSCGCSYGLKLKGQRFGKLVVLDDLPSELTGKRKVKCICDCGNIVIKESAAVNRGNYKSCGCNQFPTTTKKYRNHPLYDIWKGMKARCRDEGHIGWSIYGGNGVKVCDEWEDDFFSFYNWALSNGWEQGLQIDKDIIPKKLGIPALLYSPEMCSVVGRKENIRASKVVKINETFAIEIRESNEQNSALADKYNVSISTIQRIKSNKSWL